MEDTVYNITQMLEWSSRSLENIKTSEHSKIVIQDNFWSFITGFKTSWYYFCRWTNEISPNLSKQEIKCLRINTIEEWKGNNLNESEVLAWDVLQKVRDNNTHEKPIFPKIEEIDHFLDIGDGSFLDTGNGGFLITKQEVKYFITFEDEKYEIIELAINGLNAFKKLIKFIPKINKQ